MLLLENPKSNQKDCGNGRSDLFCVAKNAGGVPPGILRLHAVQHYFR
jgi:hypothetical protein